MSAYTVFSYQVCNRELWCAWGASELLLEGRKHGCDNDPVWKIDGAFCFTFRNVIPWTRCSGGSSWDFSPLIPGSQSFVWHYRRDLIFPHWGCVVLSDDVLPQLESSVCSACCATIWGKLQLLELCLLGPPRGCVYLGCFLVFFLIIFLLCCEGEEPLERGMQASYFRACVSKVSSHCHSKWWCVIRQLHVSHCHLLIYYLNGW